jgi:xanthine dehydrogenase YagS FAD-binding subunit
MTMPNFSYVRPKSLKEALQQLSSKGARIHAGGTDLLGCLHDDVFQVKKVVSLSHLDELRGVRQTKDGGLRIGALTPLVEVVNSEPIKEHYPALAQAASEVASPQLRDQGTLGGNICQKPRCWYYRGEFHCLRKGGSKCFAENGENHYHCIFGSGHVCYVVHPSDTAPALMAHEASVRIAGSKGTKLVTLEAFYVLPSSNVEKETTLEPNEIVTEILLPPPRKNGLRSGYRKVRARNSWDFALAGVAFALQFKADRIEKARVVLSGAAPIPWRSKPVEDALMANRLNAETVERASQAVVKNAESLEHNGYKIPLFRGLLEEELTKIAGSLGT